MHEESLSLDASDLRSRLRAVARIGPEAILLGFQGAALGEAARALRDGRLYGADPGRGRRPGRAPRRRTRAGRRPHPVRRVRARSPARAGARFARAYEAKHGQPAVPLRGQRLRGGDAPRRRPPSARPASGRGITGSRLRDVLVTGATSRPSTRASWWSATTARSDAPAGPVPGRRREARRSRATSGWTASRRPRRSPEEATPLTLPGRRARLLGGGAGAPGRESRRAGRRDLPPARRRVGRARRPQLGARAAPWARRACSRGSCPRPTGAASRARSGP